MTEYTIPSLHIRNHSLAVPLDWSNPTGETIMLFAREVVDPMRKTENLPVLAFLQGGPGGKSPRPVGGAPGWLYQAIKTHRVLLIDQRGTGLSARIDAAQIGRFATGTQGAAYLSHFRADSIVKDCEHFRKTLFGGEKWETLGQSYGGFLTLTYLSKAPEGLKACYVTGGLAGLAAQADDVYRRTYPRVAAKTKAYYARYPEDMATVAQIADLLESQDIRLPDGDRLTTRRFQSLGIDLGMSTGAENIHWLVDEAFNPDPGILSDVFLASVMAKSSYDDNPLFMVLQESIYGQNGGVSNWSASRILAEFPEFSAQSRPLMFTGEMMYPWMLQDVRSLRPFAAAAEALARHPFEGTLYNPTVLAQNEVPVAAAVYFDDMYVDAGLSLETAEKVGNLRIWVTNEFEHDGLRQSGAVLQRLMDMVWRKIP